MTAREAMTRVVARAEVNGVWVADVKTRERLIGILQSRAVADPTVIPRFLEAGMALANGDTLFVFYT